MEEEFSRSAARSSAGTATGGEQHARLGDATQRVVALVFEAGHLDDDKLAAFVSELDDIAAQLEALIRDKPATTHRARIPQGHSPSTPALDVVGVGDRFQASARFGPQFEGPPNIVHGGWIAFAFDEVLGRANAEGRFSGMTSELCVRYRRPTPIGAEAVFEAELTEQKGRRTELTGTLTVDRQIMCEATAIFVSRRTPS